MESAVRDRIALLPARQISRLPQPRAAADGIDANSATRRRGQP
jgi:hypothetical protein